MEATQRDLSPYGHLDDLLYTVIPFAVDEDAVKFGVDVDSVRMHPRLKIIASYGIIYNSYR